MSSGPDHDLPQHGGRAWSVPPGARPYQSQRAGLVTRLAAAVIDGAVVGAVLTAGYFTLAFLLFLVDPRGFALPRPGLFFSLTSGLVVAVGYLSLAWTIGGRSYGNLVMGLRVVARGGRPVGLLRATARALAVVLVPVGILWVPFGGNRSVQDVLLGTEVIYDWQPRGARTYVAQ